MTASGPPAVLAGLAAWPWYGRFFLDPLSFIDEAQRRFGPVCVLDSSLAIPGCRRLVLGIGALCNREILGQPDIYHTGGQVMPGPKGSAHRRMRTGILAMNGERHRTSRRVMQPPFQRPAVSGSISAMADLTDQLLSQWRSGEALDMFREMRTLSNWVAANILFGNEDFAASTALGDAIHRWFTLDARSRKTLLWLNFPGTAYWRTVRLAEKLEAQVKETIARNRDTRMPGSDVLSILIRVLDSGQKGMTETDLIAHALILYAASFVTTANALTWSLFFVAQHPELAADLHDEVSTQVGSWPPTMEKLESLPLLDGVVREALRLMPPVAYSLRVPVRDAELGGTPVRRGDNVLLSHFHTHRSRDVFPDPQRFKPSRWFTLRPSPYEYIPFSAGARLCLGYSFALTEVKLVVARIMQRFRLKTAPGARVDAVIRLTLQPRGGIPMYVYAQDRAFSCEPVRGNIHRMAELPH